MKKRFIPFIVILAFTAIFINACKDDKDEDPTPTPTPTSVICDGKGSTSYYPLAMQNSWYLSTSGNSITFTIVDTPTYISNKYYEVESSLGGTRYYRKKSNGDIMVYSMSSGTELLYIPGSPTVGQSWPFDMDFATTRKVAATNASYSTSKCNYTGCLKIELWDGVDLVRTDYYKKGVGLISTDLIWGGVVVTKLSSVTLH